MTTRLIISLLLVGWAAGVSAAGRSTAVAAASALLDRVLAAQARGFEVDMLDPTDPLFAKIAAAFYREQTRLFGTAGFLATDPFHEGGRTEGVDLPACGHAILDAMNGATWVLQSWQANPRQPMIDPLDKDRLLVLDLRCEAQENWRARTNFNGTPWLWFSLNPFEVLVLETQ